MFAYMATHICVSRWSLWFLALVPVSRAPAIGLPVYLYFVCPALALIRFRYCVLAACNTSKHHVLPIAIYAQVTCLVARPVLADGY